MKKEKLFDLELNKDLSVKSNELDGQTLTTAVKVSKAVCKTLTCVCSGSCFRCN
ncbi:type A lantibiotic [Salmonella enterica]|uniref:type A lantibiotic n=1 Tax=Salmonella enterica TaxID=28901 RepID=UPI0031B6109E